MGIGESCLHLAGETTEVVNGATIVVVVRGGHGREEIRSQRGEAKSCSRYDFVSKL